MKGSDEPRYSIPNLHRRSRQWNSFHEKTTMDCRCSKQELKKAFSLEPPTGVCDIKVQVFIRSIVVATTSLDRPHASDDDARDAAIFMSCVL
jgi:hypothetical protein